MAKQTVPPPASPQGLAPEGPFGGCPRHRPGPTGPCAPVRGRRGQRLKLVVTHLAGRRHLPIVELKKAA